MSYIDIKGQRFGHLKVIQRSSRKNAAHQLYWICRCDCGRLLSVRGDNLRLGVSTQCAICAGTNGRSSVFCKEGDMNGIV